jgi:hypothetical protein
MTPLRAAPFDWYPLRQYAHPAHYRLLLGYSQCAEGAGEPAFVGDLCPELMPDCRVLAEFDDEGAISPRPCWRWCAGAQACMSYLADDSEA